jgi:branched-chain amino acid transport system substrate-binding protein
MRTALTKTPLAALMLITMLGSAEAQTSAGAKPIRVGFICPFTGGSADFGNSARIGAELAAREINEVGGFLGRPVELVERDDKANPDEGRKIAEELVLKEKVDFTVGYCNSGVAAKSLDVFQDHKHLLVIPVATATMLTAKYPPASSYIFRMSPRDGVQAGQLVDDIVRRGYTRVAVFADKTGYGEGGLKDVDRLLGEKGLKPVYVARFDLGVKTLTAQMLEAKAAGADVIVGYSVGPELAVIAQSRAEGRLAAPLYGPWTMSFKTVSERAGPAAEGAIMVQSIIQDLSNERRSSFIARLKRQAGQEPVGSLMSAAQSYDAIHLMLRALFQTKGDASGDALKHALEDLQQSYRGVVTTHDRPFSANDHDAFTPNMVWLGVWRHAEVHFLYPGDAKRASVIRRKEPM